MTIHTLIPRGRLVAPGGPVTAAIRAMRMAHQNADLLTTQFDQELRELDVLRETIRRQIESDFDRIDRCLLILDSLDGDPDLTADHTTVERDAQGRLYTVGRSTDGEDADDNGLGDPEGAHEQLAAYGGTYA